MELRVRQLSSVQAAQQHPPTPHSDYEHPDDAWQVYDANEFDDIHTPSGTATESGDSDGDSNYRAIIDADASTVNYRIFPRDGPDEQGIVLPTDPQPQQVSMVLPMEGCCSGSRSRSRGRDHLDIAVHPPASQPSLAGALSSQELEPQEPQEASQQLQQASAASQVLSRPSQTQSQRASWNLPHGHMGVVNIDD
jgi:hypothetical protein